MSKKANFLPLNLSLSPFFLLLVFSCVVVHGVEEKKILSLHNNIWFPKKSNDASSSCFSHNHLGKRRESTTLEMKHKELCLGKTTDWGKKLRRALVLDNLRVQSLQLKIQAMSSSTTTQSISETQIPLTSGVQLQTLNYIVTVDLGGKNMTLIVDTGSDLTWVQCKPCRSCYNQQGPLYDPYNSSSYKTVLCNSTTCQNLAANLVAATGNSGQCGGNNGVKKTTCDYVVNYGDGSYTRGDLGSESIQLGDTKVENFIFGCGRNNRGLFGGASGLMGLGRSSLSLIYQTTKAFDGVFSYCLPSLEDGSSGSLSFGYKNSTSVVSYTPLVQNSQLHSFYILNLTGITIGGVELETSSFGKGILIDSGTVISRLPPSIYKAVKTEFLKQFSGYPSAPGYSILDTCFNLTSYEDVSIPTIEMIFEGNAALEVDVTGVFYFVNPDASLACLALASLSYENEVGIIGNYQQRNQRVIYDTKQDKLGIAGENCGI